jgi:glycosyltransferase involved in cell wall biosynthesis
MVTGRTSVIIPSRNEIYLKRTIQDLLEHSTGDVEIIAVVDGYWPDRSEIVEDSRVRYLHFGEPKGMRNAINQAVAISTGEFLLKSDAHCSFSEMYDEVLKKDLENNWIAVPRRYALDPVKWELENNPKYPVDYMYLSNDLHGNIWDEKNKDEALKEKTIDDLMSAQGSCWFMKRNYFDFLELLDEKTYGTFWSEFQEIGLKCWLSGGRVIVNKKTFYSHWHKPSSVGRGYNLPHGEKEQTGQMVNKWLTEKVWHKQTQDIQWLVNKFAPVPTWT